MCKGPEAETHLMGKEKAGVLSVRKKSDVRGEVGWKEGPRDGGTCSSLKEIGFIFSAVGHYWNIEARNLIHPQRLAMWLYFQSFIQQVVSNHLLCI